MGSIAQRLKNEGIQEERQASLERERLIRQACLERERQTLLKVAYALLDDGVSLDVVIKSTGLSREVLEKPRH